VCRLSSGKVTRSRQVACVLTTPCEEAKTRGYDGWTMNTTSGVIDAQRVELGRWIYSAWKHLRGYPAQTAASFEATVLSGKCCDLLGRMRQLAPYTMSTLAPLAKDAGLARTELTRTVLPYLEALGIVQIDRSGEQIARVRAFVLSQADVMDQVGRLWETLDPESVERAAITLLQGTATLPLTREEASAACVGVGISEEDAAQGIELALSHDLVRETHVADFDANFLYNDFLWGENIQHVAGALAALPADRRDALRSLMDELHAHEGRPVQEIESASPELVKLAATRGLIDATEITTALGKTATFHFTPRFRGFGVSRDDVPDVLDQVKLVIASFAFSTRYARYTLRDPELFLDRLINSGYAGNASPIGTDYGAMERQKIVDVEPTGPGSSRYRFRALKTETLVEARDTMRAGALLLPNPGGLAGGGSLREPQGFSDPVATRQRLAREVGNRPLHDQALLAAIRDAAQQDRFR
jgi:hypothetical protein